MNQFIAEALSAEFNVLRTINGREGLERARASRPDLITSDIMMPYMSGDQLLGELKKEDVLRDIPLLFLSARADDQMRVNLLREGANDYLVKPFSAEELRARVSNLVALRLTRQVLEREVDLKSANIVELAQEVSQRKREADLAIEVASAAREQAEKANQAKGAFLSLVSHELNTPLMTMGLSLDLLARKHTEALDPTQAKLVERLSGSTRHLQSLVEGLIEYVRADQKIETDLHAETDLKKVIDEVVSECAPLAASKSLELRVLVPDRLPPLPYDPNRIRVLLSNLLINALKFTKEGFVEIQAALKDHKVILSVKDSGPGIAELDRERIFEPFERIEPLERKSIPGMGLGLALVKQLVSLLRIKLELQSEEGEGSTFSLEFLTERT